MRSWTTRAWCSLAAAAAAWLIAAPAAAAIQTDPAQLYATMKGAYDRAASHGWTYDDQRLYFGAVLDAGRAYALDRPDDPNAFQVAGLTVDVATLLHYDPITDDDASTWYVRQACETVLKGADPSRAAEARTILARLTAGDADLGALARIAVADAAAIVKDYHDAPATRIAQIDTEARAYNLTKDPAYRSAALRELAEASFPIDQLPDPPGVEVVTWANSAVAGVHGYSAADVASAREFLRRRAALKDPPIIARVIALPHDLRLLITAPADEYFGRLKMSPLGIGNDVVRIGKYLDAGWGTRMTQAALDLEDAIEEWQKGYPRDYALPRTLLSAYKTFERIGSPEAQAAAGRMKALLTIEYGDSSQAQELLGT